MSTLGFKSSRGFSLVEVLIVIAIIALLVSLSMPAIQSSREAARRTQCQNNQRQMGVAFLNYELNNKAFPSGYTLKLMGPLTTDPSATLYNYLIDLLPFLEETNVASQFNRDVIFCAPENAPAIGANLSVMICPSTPDDRTPAAQQYVPSLQVGSSARKQLKAVFDKLDAKYTFSFKGGLTDYAIPTSAEDGFARWLGYNVAPGDNVGIRGMFPAATSDTKMAAAKIIPILASAGTAEFSHRTRTAQVTDGLSHTFIMTEDAGRPNHYRRGARYPTGEPLSCAWADPHTLLELNGLGEGNDRCVLQCENDSEIFSFHPDGINFLFADGHGDFLSDTTDPHLILALMTPDQDDNHNK